MYTVRIVEYGIPWQHLHCSDNNEWLNHQKQYWNSELRFGCTRSYGYSWWKEYASMKIHYPCCDLLLKHEDGGLTRLKSVLQYGWRNRGLGVGYGFIVILGEYHFLRLLSFWEILRNPSCCKSKWSLILFMVIMMVLTVLRIGIPLLRREATITQFDYGTFGQWVVSMFWMGSSTSELSQFVTIHEWHSNFLLPVVTK